MVLRWRLTFLWQGQISPYAFVWALYNYMVKMLSIHILDISSEDYDPVDVKLDEDNRDT